MGRHHGLVLLIENERLLGGHPGRMGECGDGEDEEGGGEDESLGNHGVLGRPRELE